MKMRNNWSYLCAIVFALTSAVQAPALNWDANGTGSGQADGTGTWLGASQWWDGSGNVTWNNSTPDDAVIGNGGTAGTITVGTVTAGSIVLTNFTGIYTFDGTVGSTTLSQSGGITISTNAANITFKNTVIGGTGGITMNSPGTLILGANPVAAHTYTGPTVINAGTVMVFGNKTAGNFTLNNGMLTDYYQQTTIFSGGLGMGNNQIQIYGDSGFGGGNGNSSWRIGGQNSVLTWGSTYFNPTTLKLRSTADNNGPSIYGQITLQNRLDLNSGTRTISVLRVPTYDASYVSSWAKIDAGIQDTGGTGSLIIIGGGMLILGGTTSTWGGGTTISNGVLQLDGTSIANIGGGSGRNITVGAGCGIRFNAMSNAILNRLVETNAEITVMTGSTDNNLDFSGSTGANLPKAFLGNWASNGAKMEYKGILTPASDAYRLGGKFSTGLLGIVRTNMMTGSQGLIVGGSGYTTANSIRVELAAAQDFTGDTVINTGARLSLASNLALQNSTLDVGSSGGHFSLSAGTNAGKISGGTNAPSPTLGGLKGSRNLYTVFSTSAGNNETLLAATAVTGFTLNLASGKTNTYAGNIGGFGIGASGANGGAMTLTKTGPGTQIFSGKLTYTNATIIQAGTFTLGAHNVLTNIAPVSIGNGTFDTSTYTNAVGTLEVTGSTGAINLGVGGKLAFADSSAVTWSGSELKVTGDYVQSSSIRFGTTSGGLTSGQLAKIKVVGGGYATLDANGYLKTYRGILIIFR